MATGADVYDIYAAHLCFSRPWAGASSGDDGLLCFSSSASFFCSALGALVAFDGVNRTRTIFSCHAGYVWREHCYAKSQYNHKTLSDTKV